MFLGPSSGTGSNMLWFYGPSTHLNLYVTHVTIAEYRKREPATAIIARKNFAKIVQMLTRVRE